jgi:hypothetical protein
MYQISIKGQQPIGPLFQTESAAKREIHFLMLDDLAYAEEAMREAGIRVELTEYEIHKVEVE